MNGYKQNRNNLFNTGLIANSYLLHVFFLTLINKLIKNNEKSMLANRKLIWKYKENGKKIKNNKQTHCKNVTFNQQRRKWLFLILVRIS